MKPALAKLFERLGKSMVGDYRAMHPQRNPVVSLRNNAKKLGRVIRQYSFLSKHAVPFLENSNRVLRKNGWRSLAEQIEENIAEERGKAQEAAHYEIFCRGAKNELALDLKRTRASDASKAFVKRWLEISRHARPEFVAGALYAFELTGVPEMSLVKALLNDYSTHALGRPLDRKGRLAKFFDSHTGHFEVKHAQRIRDNVGAHLNTKAQHGLFAKGFHELMGAMDGWWAGMAAEAARTGVKKKP